ncbi:MAG: type II toxin-antitoxin system VapC family toxin [Chryseotalea sp. WA131a]|nr:MAG: type II toxin-antitoxin system VapC family toxin [Chryseotalea sp. WA131a]
MEQDYLIDTNSIINFANKKLPSSGSLFVSKVIDINPIISIINKIEVQGFADPNNQMIELIEASTIIPLTDEMVDETIAIRKIHKVKLPDAIIAATAKTKNLTLITRNETDFDSVSGLTIINPWKI